MPERCVICGNMKTESNYHKRECPGWQLHAWREKQLEEPELVRIRFDHLTDEEFMLLFEKVVSEGMRRKFFTHAAYLKNRVVNDQIIIYTTNRITIADQQLTIRIPLLI